MMSPDAQAEQTERARRKQEAALSLLLLGLSNEARGDLVSYVKHGGDVRGPLTKLFGGEGAEYIAAAMADEYLASFERAQQLIGSTATAEDHTKLAERYGDQAKAATNSIVTTIATAIEAERQASPDASPQDVLEKAFEQAGYTSENSDGIELGVERNIVSASNDGLLGAASGERIKLMHVSVLDAVTTEICRERAGIVKYADDPYWSTNTPSLHWFCRSTVVIAPDDAEITDGYPATPAEVGFGEAVQAAAA